MQRIGRRSTDNGDLFGLTNDINGVLVNEAAPDDETAPLPFG